MKNDHPKVARYASVAAIFCGLVLLVFGSVYFFNASAKTDDIKNSPDQVLTNGKLAFSYRNFGPTNPAGRIVIANPDGTGGGTLGTPRAEDVGDPAWSPDGSKIAFISVQPNQDLYVINLDGTGVMNLTNTGGGISENAPSWSPAGKIAYQRTSQIWVVNADGTGNAQFSGITQPSPNSPEWSPDGSKLAFVSGTTIWVIDANGTNERQVVTSADAPAWSPDGTKLLFVRSGGTFVINLDGTNEALIATSAANPAWSPDGTKIAFRRGGIMTMDPDGGNQVRIITDIIQFPLCCDIIHDSPKWQPFAQTPNTFHITGRVTDNAVPVVGATVNLSGAINAAVTTDAVGNYQFSGLTPGGNYTVSPSMPNHYFAPTNRSFNNLTSNQVGNFEVSAFCQNGRCTKNGKIAFMRDGDIFTINPDGSSQTNITNNAASDDHPHYSPFGTNILFATNRDGNYEIYRMDQVGNSLVRLTNNSASDRLPFYSPDGGTIIFVSDRDGNSEIYKMNADGTNQVRLTNDAANDTYPAFSPDGNKIIFVRSGSPSRVFTMNADGSNPQQFPAPGGPVPNYERPNYSPDGSKIMFTYTSDASSVIRVTYTMNANGSSPARFPADGSYGIYSADGKSAAHTCCIFDNTNRLRSSNSLGNSVRTLTPSNFGNALPHWQGFRIPRAPFDFDGDGRSDISVFRPSNGGWYLLRSTAGLWVPVWGLATDVLAPADYDGDLKTDVAVWRPSEGNYYILNSFDATVRIENFGLAGDVPTGGDWDGDGKADPAVYRNGSQSYFYFRGSMGNPNGNITYIPWGVNGDRPVTADYDGDGRTDPAIYRNGTWWISQSSTGQPAVAGFGLATDTLIPADYDADGKTDIAVFRDGIWYLLRSAQGFGAFQFGIAGDIPTPADYDGDGRADAAIYRNGVWWILNSQSGTPSAVQFGLGSDSPVPSSFVR